MKRSFLCSGSVVAVSTAFLLVACGGDTIGDTIVIPVGDGGPTVDATTDAAPPDERRDGAGCGDARFGR